MATFGESFFRTIRGKVGQGFFSRNLTNSLWGKSTTIDYVRNDYDLYRSLYFGASINGKGRDMQTGAMFAKAIVNSAAGFAIGDGFKISMDEKHAKVEQKINDWIEGNRSAILDVVRHQMRDGDAYLYVDEYGTIDEFDAKNVDVMLDPMTGEVIGYDINEIYEEVTPEGVKQKWNMLRQYRTDSIRYLKFKDNQREQAEVIYNRVFTSEGAVEPTENQQYFVDDIIPRALPVVHFANDPEPRAVYGNSELLNCLTGIQNYTAVISNATKGVIYNSSPVPYITGVASPDRVASDSNKNETDDTDKTNWGPDTVLYFADKEANAGFLQANGFMADTGQLLEYYFMLIVQASETPEFVFGTGIQGSRASVETQMPIVTQKAERKRAQLEHPFKQLIDAYIDRRIRLSDPDFLKLKNADYEINIEFPDLQMEDKSLTLNIVKEMLAQGILSEETALSLVLGDKIPDITKEIEEAHKDAEAKVEANPILPDEPDRLQEELNSQGVQDTNPTDKTAQNGSTSVENTPVPPTINK